MILDDLEILNDLFAPTALIPLSEEYGKKLVTLTEENDPESSIAIKNVPDDAIIIDLDNNFSNDKLFQGNKKECKRADFIIFSEDKKCILFIEMKKGSVAKSHHIINQLKGSFCVFQYIQSIAAQFFDSKDFLKDYKKRFISIKETGNNSRKTSLSKDKNGHDTPDKPMKLKWAKQVQFNQLAT